MTHSKQYLKKENEDYKNIDKLIFIFFSSYFIFTPFYFWKSGLPQISDIIMIFTMVIYIFINKMFIKIKVDNLPIIKAALYFITYLTFINLIWMFVMDDSMSLGRVSLYYIFNYLILVMFLTLYTQYGAKILSIIYKSITISIYIQLLIFIINGGYTGVRMTGSFNNPNQLGYYALITTTILIYLTQKIEIESVWFILSIISTTLLVSASLSSTAIGAYLFLIMIFIFSKIDNLKLKRNFVLSFIIIIILILYLKNYTSFFENSQMIAGLNARLKTVSGKTDRLVTERGYNRIIDYPEYWIFGAGEGKYLKRFGIASEFHSLFGNIQVSYGLIGTILFSRVLWLSFKQNFLNKIIVFVPILIYGVTHNSIRSGLFWILLGLFAVDQNKETNIQGK